MFQATMKVRSFWIGASPGNEKNFRFLICKSRFLFLECSSSQIQNLKSEIFSLPLERGLSLLEKRLHTLVFIFGREA